MKKEFDIEFWAKENSLFLAKSYLKDNPDVKWSEEFLQQLFYEKIMKTIRKLEIIK